MMADQLLVQPASTGSSYWRRRCEWLAVGGVG